MSYKDITNQLQKQYKELKKQGYKLNTIKRINKININHFYLKSYINDDEYISLSNYIKNL